MKPAKHLAGTTLLFLSIVCTNSLAAGFWDEGLDNGRARSDDITLPLDIDTAVHPTQGRYVDCEYPNTDFPFNSLACTPWGPAKYNPWRWDEWASLPTKCLVSCPTGNQDHWTLIHNVEPSFMDAGEWASGEDWTPKHPNPGPPDLSYPVYGLGQTDKLMRAAVTTSGPGTKRVILITETSDTLGPIPFLAFGADLRDGNGQGILVMNSNDSYDQGIKVSLRHALSDTRDAAQHDSYVSILLQFFAEFGGDMYLLQIPLYEAPFSAYDLDGDGSTADDAIARDWNWPFKDSVYYPGAKVVYATPSYISANCNINIPEFSGANWQTKHLTLPVEELFKCLSLSSAGDLIPNHSLSVLQGFYIVAESSGFDTYLRTDFWNLRTYQIAN